MDFDLPEELRLLKDTVRKFVDRELIPLERECRPEGEDMPEQYIKPLQEKAKAIGLWLLDVPLYFRSFAAKRKSASRRPSRMPAAIRRE